MTGPLISPEECAAALGISHATVRALVREGKWAHIGAGAVQGSGERWVYTIPRQLFARWVAGELPVMQVTVTVAHEATPDETLRQVLEQALAALPAR